MVLHFEILINKIDNEYEEKNCLNNRYCSF